MSDQKPTAPAVPSAVSEKPRPKAINLRDLMQKTFAEDHMLVSDGLLQKNGIMIIGGPPKSYKSFVLNTVLFHLATGTNLFGATRSPHGREIPVFKVARPCRVLLLEQEIGEPDLQARFKLLLSSIPPEVQETFYDNTFSNSCEVEMKLDTVAGAHRIEELIKDCKPDVVAFDPLYEFHDSDENNSQQMGFVLTNIDRLRQRYGFATILCHHTSKQSSDLGGKRGGDLLRGSSALFGKGDSVLLLEVKNRSKGELRMEFTIRRGPTPDPVYLTLNKHDMRVRFTKWQGNQYQKGADD